MMNPYACFDCLAIGCRLQTTLGDVAAGEIHLFAYLACLLSLYKKRPVADWEYQFAGTSAGAPFSREIDEAISGFLLRGFIEGEADHLKVTSSGKIEYEMLCRLSQNADRDTFIDGACSSILALPVGVIRNAIFHEPELSKASTLTDPRRLLEGPGLRHLYDHFSALSSAIGVDVQNLMMPAVVWITYLTRVSD